jgi:tetratricopeptide (TPR) repeat protein
LRKIAFEDATPPRKLDKGIPVELETITLKCLAKNPAERYATAGDLADDLKRWLDDQPIKAKPPTLFQRTARRLRRHPKAMAAVFAALLLAAVGAVAGAVLIDRQKQRAEGAYARARLALDELSSQVIDDWLAKQPALTADQKRFLERALGHYEWLADHSADDAETRAGVAAAYLRVGDIRAKLGQTAEAEAAYARAVELYRRLADESPAEPAYRLALAKAYRARGGVLRRLGRLGDAEPAYRQALALLERFASDAPAEPGDWSELAGTLLDYGDLLRQTDRMTEAEETYRRGVNVVRGPAGQTPAALYRLGQLHVHLGTLLYRFSHLAEAEQAARRGVQVLEGLLEAVGGGPGTGLYREALAEGWTELAHTLGTIGLNRPAEAEAADRRAVEVWEKLAADFPAVPEYRHRLALSVYGLGNHLYDQGQYPEAQAEYRRAVTLLEKLTADYPGEPRYRESLAKTFRHLGAVFNRTGQPAEAEQAYRQAIRTYREAIRLLPDTALAHADLGALLAEKGDADGAIAEYREAIRLDPGNFSAHNNLGAVLSDVKRDYDGAIACFRRAIALDPNVGQAHLNLGITLARKGQHAAAEAAFREAVKLKPDSAEYRSDLGWVLSILGRTDEAIAESREAIRLNPDDWRGHINLGCLLCDVKHDYDGATACFRRVIALDPKNADARINLGITLTKMGQTDAAIAEYREAIRLDPRGCKAQINLGTELSNVKGDYDGAIACFRRAIALDPNFPGAHLNLGQALEHQGQSAAAAAALREAVKLQPDQAAVQNALGWFLATCSDPRLRDPKQAVAAAKKAVEREPRKGSFWNTLGVAYYRNGEYPAVVEALGRATELPNDETQSGGNSFDWFFLAMAHQQLGEKDLARQCYSKAVEWMKKNRPDCVKLRRFRAEAEEVLGIPPPAGP